MGVGTFIYILEVTVKKEVFFFKLGHLRFSEGGGGSHNIKCTKSSKDFSSETTVQILMLL